MSLAVKSGRPPSRDGLISRPRLLERLRQGSDLPLVLIVAPAGYGKTSLLADWTRHEKRPSTWIGLEQWHSDPIVLVKELLRALDELEPIDPRLLRELEGGAPDLDGEVLPRLASTLEARTRETVIALDDVHTIEGPACSRVLSAVVEHLPAGSQLALASRTRPPLPLGRLRAHRALLELSAEDLAMTRPEAQALLRLVGLRPTSADVRTALASTEGWPAGLYLAALSCRDESDSGAALDRFAGDDYVVADYLRDELLSDLDEEDLSFLVRTSVAERLSWSLCDALLERSGSSRVLDRLGRGSLPFTPTDRSHESYRAHRLLREMLLGELRREDPQSEAELHRRASAWYALHEDLPGAIDHAIAGGDAERAGELLWANLPRYPAESGEDTIQRRLSELSPEQLACNPLLALTAAHVALARGELRQAERWGLVVKAALACTPTPKLSSLSVGARILDAAVSRNGIAAMGRDAAAAYELTPRDSPWRSICCLLRGVSDHLAGERDRAREHLEEGIQCSDVATPMVEVLCLSQLALLSAEDGDLERGVELIERAGPQIERHGLARHPISALALAVSAELRARAGHIDEAKRDVRRAGEQLVRLGEFIPWYGVQTRVVLARAAMRLTDLTTARALLAEASRPARRVPDAAVFCGWLEEAWGLIDAFASSALQGPAALTMAELRILRFLPTHLSLREIGARLHVSTNTVKTQAHAVYRKLDASSRSEAVARAWEIGLLQR